MKIRDALAAAVPIVTTMYGKEGICVEPGKEIIVVDDPTCFAPSVVRLLRGGTLRDSVGDASRRYVEQLFSGDSLAATIEETYKVLSLGRVI